MASFFGTLFGGEAEKEAAAKNIAALQKYEGSSLDALKQQYGISTGYGQQAIGAYAPLTAIGNKYAGATDLQLDALGVNGPEGTARAQTAMQATPGYSAGIEAVMRKRGGNYMGGTGNADQDLINYATNSVYAPWMQNVTNAAQMGGNYLTAGAQGTAAGYGKLADLSSLYGQNQTGIYGNVASGTIDANKLQAAGESAGAKNLLGAGMSLASMALGMPMGGMGGGGGAYSGGSYNFSGSPLGQLTQWAGNKAGNLFAPPGGYTGWASA